MQTDHKEIFIYNFTYLRKKYGISKKKMAELLDISVTSVNKIERGELPPKLNTNIIFKIQNLFGVAVKDLMGKHLEK